MGDFGVYVHIPFCARRCDYCAFATWTDRDHLVERYVRACRRELVDARMADATSVFFGGGTPSLIAPDLLAGILGEVPSRPGAEVTVECNPDTVTPELLDVYVAAGVNRISLGVQSMVPHVLRALGRVHDAANVTRAVTLAADAGITRVNVDLIYGAVDETLNDWRLSVEAVLELDPQPSHVSAYALTVEPGTPLARDPARHPDDDDQAAKYELADELFTAVGLTNYEISNWARPGDECRHNLLYWSRGDYRGIGCAAHSHEAGRRWWNVRTPDRYIDLVERGESLVAGEERLDDATRRFEALELSLRMASGVPADTLPIEDLGDLVSVTGDHAVLTRRGRLLASDIATRLRV